MQGRAQPNEGACKDCLFSSVSLLYLLDVFVCCTFTCMHRDLVVAFSRIVQKSSHFVSHKHTKSNTLSNTITHTVKNTLKSTHTHTQIQRHTKAKCLQHYTCITRNSLQKKNLSKRRKKVRNMLFIHTCSSEHAAKTSRS